MHILILQCVNPYPDLAMYNKIKYKCISDLAAQQEFCMSFQSLLASISSLVPADKRACDPPVIAGRGAGRRPFALAAAVSALHAAAACGG